MTQIRIALLLARVYHYIGDDKKVNEYCIWALNNEPSALKPIFENLMKI